MALVVLFVVSPFALGGQWVAINYYNGELGDKTVKAQMPSLAFVFKDSESGTIEFGFLDGSSILLDDHSVDVILEELKDRTVEDWESHLAVTGGGGSMTNLEEYDTEVAGVIGKTYLIEHVFDCSHWVDVCERNWTSEDPLDIWFDYHTVFELNDRLYEITFLHVENDLEGKLHELMEFNKELEIY